MCRRTKLKPSMAPRKALNMQTLRSRPVLCRRMNKLDWARVQPTSQDIQRLSVLVDVFVLLRLVQI
eukprot:5036826-Amphidinium_carterae.1